MTKGKPIGKIVSLKQDKNSLTIVYKPVVEIPMTPNFIRVAGTMRPIAELTEPALRKVGREWTKALIAKAATRRKND